MNTLRAAASDYLTLRRALGFKLYDAGLLLEQFIDFLQANRADTITTALAVHWATEPRGVLPAWHARRLAVVRGFARWRQATDPVTEVPPNGLLPAHTRRATPYLYSGQEIAALMAAAARLPSPLRAATMQAFIGLVFATGIRRGEALGLDDGDLDPAAGMLTVRRAKLDKTRRLPLHRSTMAALVDYQHRRDRLFPNLAADALFVSTTGARLSAATVSSTFLALLPQAGIQPPTPARRPHIHDARHTFAVNTLLEWYRDGGDVAARLPLLSAYLGHTSPVHTYISLPHRSCSRWPPPGCRHAPDRGCGHDRAGPDPADILHRPPGRQHGASSHTIASYRDSLRLLLVFTAERTDVSPAQLQIENLDAPLVAAFLDHLEHERGNNARTRNTRLAAIHSLFRYAALRHPEHAATIARVLAIPPKRCDKAVVSFLEDAEVDALLAAPDTGRWIGRRDHALLLLAVQTGLRVSELTGLRCADVHLGRGPHVQCAGKGRKQRCTPLTGRTVAALRAWLAERQGHPDQPLFPTGTGGRLSPDAVAFLLAKHVATARRRCPSLAAKTVTPHALRHTCAMTLLRAGVDTSVIALWLGHEKTDTLQIYLHADLTLKERALARTAPRGTTTGRYKPPDDLLAFLEAL